MLASRLVSSAKRLQELAGHDRQAFVEVLEACHKMTREIGQSRLDLEKHRQEHRLLRR
jgi:hypothetical protein